jgi:hypothetical protein
MTTYTLIASTVVGSSTSVSLGSIPQGYDDLVLVWKGGSTSAPSNGYGFKVTFNGSTGGYQNLIMRNNAGVALSAYKYANWGYIQANTLGDEAPYEALVVMNISEYSKTNKFKNATVQFNAPTRPQQATIGARWDNTAAITSIQIGDDFGNSIYGRFYLYGIGN